MAVLPSYENIVANVPKVVVFPFHNCGGTKKAPLKDAYIFFLNLSTSCSSRTG